MTMKIAAAALLATAATFLSGCGSLDLTMPGLLPSLQQADPKPEYQKGLIYLPIDTGKRKLWLVRGYFERENVAGSSAYIAIWYGQDGIMLRTITGKLVTTRGLPGPRLFGIEKDSCPSIADMAGMRGLQYCRRTRHLSGLAGYENVESLRVMPAIEAEDNPLDVPGPLKVVREFRLSDGKRVNAYYYSRDGEYLGSLQLIGMDQYVLIRKAESVQ